MCIITAYSFQYVLINQLDNSGTYVYPSKQ